MVMLMGLLVGSAATIDAAPPPGLYVDEFRLVAGDGATGGQFGFSVGVSGDTVVIGAPGDDGLGDESGAAYLFVPDGAGWAEAAKLTASDGASGDEFGSSVAIDGHTVVIGARGDGGSGSAYVFVRDPGGWKEQDKLTPAVPVANAEFGHAVAVHGDTAVVAAPGMDADPFDGSVYAFVRSGAIWSQQVVISGGEDFGGSVGVWGDTMVVGAWRDDTDRPLGDGGFQGAAYVYERNGTTWGPATKLLPSDWDVVDTSFGSVREDFGEAVAIWDDTIVVGEPAFTTSIFGPGAGSGGEVYAFVRDAGGTWSEQADMPPSEWDGPDPTDNDFGDWYGGALAIHGDVVAIGSTSRGYDMGEGGTERVLIWARDGTDWSGYGARTASDGTPDDRFATSVGVSEGVLVMGAPGAGDAGAAYIRETTPILCDGLRATIVGTPGDDILEGTTGPDVISGLGGNDNILGLGGDDVVCGGDGDDLIRGHGGNDLLLGNDGNDTLLGGDGDDVLRGMRGNDVLRGDDGDDKLNGSSGDDTLFGQQGNDRLNGGVGWNVLNGGPDRDSCTGGSVVRDCEH